MATKKYVSLDKLSTSLDNLKNTFATKTEINANLTAAQSYADNKDSLVLESSQTYTDNAVAEKSQVQIITLEAND